jgi:NAD(P) transhydrogenase
MAPEKYDLIVIGSGPAGEKGAAQVAYFGKKVALIEKELELGGAAANTGTIPSKTLRETALFLSGFRNRQLDGLHITKKEQVTVRDFLARERLVMENERTRIQDNLRWHRVTRYAGVASFVDPHTIAVQPERCPAFHIRGDVILIATGSYPFRPPLYQFHDPRVYDSDTVLHLHAIPDAMLVAGGGVIGCEYACMFAALGVQVTVVEKRTPLINFMDWEISEALRAKMEAMGIRILMPDVVEQVVPREECLEVRTKAGVRVEVNNILVSSGRCGSTDGLGLEQVGIQPGDRGQIRVNEHFQTSVPHIYAAGDVIGFPALASTAMEQARSAMVHAFNLQTSKRLDILPYGIYTIPECSMAGETEESLKKQNVPYVVGKATYEKNARGQIVGDTGGFLKLLFHEEDMRLLGVHMIGEQATEVIHVGLTALLVGADVNLFIQTCYNYPTLTEMYKYAAYAALGQQRARQLQRAAQVNGPAAPVQAKEGKGA